MDTFKKPVHEVCIDKTDCQTEQHRKTPPHEVDQEDLFRKNEQRKTKA